MTTLRVIYMGRPLRNFVPGEYYHIVARGNNRSTIFHETADYHAYLHLIKQMLIKFEIRLFHYTLMPNHIHLLLACDSNLSEAMHHLNLGYSKFYRKKYCFIGHLWQARYKSFHINDDAYLLSCGNYIEMNPVRARLVNLAVDWPYSSIRYYSHGQSNLLLTEDPLFVSMGHTNLERRTNYEFQLSLTRNQPGTLVPGT